VKEITLLTTFRQKRFLETSNFEKFNCFDMVTLNASIDLRERFIFPVCEKSLGGLSMNKALNPSQIVGHHFQAYQNNTRFFDEAVFKVQDPPCPCCQDEMDFLIFENFEGTGTDWIQWRCKNDCGFFKNIEIL